MHAWRREDVVVGYAGAGRRAIVCKREVVSRVTAVIVVIIGRVHCRRQSVFVERNHVFVRVINTAVVVVGRNVRVARILRRIYRYRILKILGRTQEVLTLHLFCRAAIKTLVHLVVRVNLSSEGVAHMKSVIVVALSNGLARNIRKDRPVSERTHSRRCTLRHGFQSLQGIKRFQVRHALKICKLRGNGSGSAGRRHRRIKTEMPHVVLGVDTKSDVIAGLLAVLIVMQERSVGHRGILLVAEDIRQWN